jgi:hypothetical protein
VEHPSLLQSTSQASSSRNIAPGLRPATLTKLTPGGPHARRRLTAGSHPVPTEHKRCRGVSSPRLPGGGDGVLGLAKVGRPQGDADRRPRSAGWRRPPSRTMRSRSMARCSASEARRNAVRRDRGRGVGTSAGAGSRREAVKNPFKAGTPPSSAEAEADKHGPCGEPAELPVKPQDGPGHAGACRQERRASGRLARDSRPTRSVRLRSVRNDPFHPTRGLQEAAHRGGNEAGR